jgi:phage-related holin
MKETIIKNGIATIAFLVSYFSPAFHLMLAIGFFIICDMVTGIMAAKKRGEEITSKKMRPTVTKGIGYMIAILVAHVFEQHFIQGFEAMKIVAGLIAFIEVKSLDENFRVITGKSLFKQFLKK